MKSEFQDRKTLTDSLSEIRDSLLKFANRPEPTVTVNPPQVTVRPEITIPPNEAPKPPPTWDYEITSRDKDGFVKTFTATPRIQN